MRIALVGPPFDGLGGIQQYIRTLKRALEELGHEVMVVTKKHPFLPSCDRAIITHRNYLPFAFPLRLHCRHIILLLHGIDAERELTWLEALSMAPIKTIWVISEWTKGLAKKFNKPTEILYLCVS